MTAILVLKLASFQVSKMLIQAPVVMLDPTVHTKPLINSLIKSSRSITSMTATCYTHQTWIYNNLCARPFLKGKLK
jgi:hypothetical protein